MSDNQFRREDRYIVIKLTDMEKAKSDLRSSFSVQCRKLHDSMLTRGAPARQFLVIESDWPEYEPVWKMIERRMSQPAAHLTIPGALEWDGDNGTHGADGELRAHSESAAVATLQSLGYTYGGGQLWKPPIGKKPDFDLMTSLRVQLDNTEQSRRSFFDLSQDLEKRLAERDRIIFEAISYVECDTDPACKKSREQLLSDIAALSASTEPSGAACAQCGGWGHIETEDSAHDCPECGPSVIERAVEARVMK